jgi:putative endonuclease
LINDTAADELGIWLRWERRQRHRCQSKLFNPAFLTEKNLPTPPGLEKQAIVIPANAGIHAGNRTMFYVHLLSSKPCATLCTGVTTDLTQRVWQHKSKAVPGFTAKYGVDRLVWLKSHEDREAAIRRGKQIKEWKRDWKIELIERDNPHWLDLDRELRE